MNTSSKILLNRAFQYCSEKTRLKLMSTLQLLIMFWSIDNLVDGEIAATGMQSIQMPKPSIPHFVERKRRSVVGEFNRVQQESGKGQCSNGSSHNWLKGYRPKVAISPHQEDYCDTCAKKKEAIRAKQTTINCLKAAAASEESEMKKLDDEVKSLQQSLEDHRQEAQAAHEYFNDVTKKCEGNWNKIVLMHAGKH